MKKAAQVLREVRSVTGKKDKLAILQENKGNKELMAVLKLAYDKSYNFYTTVVPKSVTGGESIFTLEYALQLFVEKLSTRAVSGKEALTLVSDLYQGLSLDDRESLSYVIRRDVKAGISAKTVLKVWPDLFPYFGYQRCSSKGVLPFPCYSQLKSDAIFSRFFVKGNNVKGVTRNGTPLVNLPHSFSGELGQMGDGVYEGELGLQLNGEVLPREISNGMVNSCFIAGTGILKDGYSLILPLWDKLDTKCYWDGLDPTPYSERLKCLEEGVLKSFTHLSVIPYIVVNNELESITYYQEQVSKGLEGCVLKSFDAVWKDGTSKEQIKVKVEEIVELRCIGTKPAAEGSKNEGTFGSLLFESECGKLRVAATGIPDKQRKEIHENIDYYMGKVGAVKGNGLTKPSKSNEYWSLFLPNFVEWRDHEKDTANTLEEIQEVFEC